MKEAEGKERRRRRTRAEQHPGGQEKGFQQEDVSNATENSSRSLERGLGTDLTSWVCLVPLAASGVVGDGSQESE